MELRNKKVIFIAPQYFSMQNEIKEALEKNGAIVDYFEDKVFHHDSRFNNCYGIRKTVYKFFDDVLKHKDLYWKKRIRQFKSYDILFWIDGYSFSPLVIDELRKKNKNIERILYLYDDTTFYKFEDLFKYFDRVSTFDENDYHKLQENYNISYLPLYWRKIGNGEKKYDISCIGYCIEERLDTFEYLDTLGFFNEKNCYIKLYLPSLSLGSYLKNLIKYIFFKREKRLLSLILGKTKSRFITRLSVPKNETDKIISQSKCVIDIVKKTQTGFSNRFMQTIGNGVKIITSNKSIKNTPFYNKSCVYILESDSYNLQELEQFINSPIKYTNYEYLNDLEINNWVLKI